MGIIVRQGFKSSIVSYIGVVIGIFNILILYNQYHDPGAAGFVRFYPAYFSGYLHVFCLAGRPIGRCTVSQQVSGPRIAKATFYIHYHYATESAWPLLWDYIYFSNRSTSGFILTIHQCWSSIITFSFPLTVGMVYLLALESYSRINLRIAVPSLIRGGGPSPRPTACL
jgi:hypothetical protein